MNDVVFVSVCVFRFINTSLHGRGSSLATVILWLDSIGSSNCLSWHSAEVAMVMSI